MALTGELANTLVTWLASDSHKPISCTAAVSHSKISSLKSLNSTVWIYREASSRMLHPRLSIESDRVVSASLERVRRCIWAVLYMVPLTVTGGCFWETFVFHVRLLLNHTIILWIMVKPCMWNTQIPWKTKLCKSKLCKTAVLTYLGKRWSK